MALVKILCSGLQKLQSHSALCWPNWISSVVFNCLTCFKTVLINQRSLKGSNQNKECPESHVKGERGKKSVIVILDRRKFEDLNCLLILRVGLGGRRMKNKNWYLSCSLL